MFKHNFVTSQELFLKLKGVKHCHLILCATFMFCINTHSCVFIDYIVVGSDSGRIVILEYHPSKNMFEKIHQETFGKSGCRRIVPGQFLAVDPKGRAVMIGMDDIKELQCMYDSNRCKLVYLQDTVKCVLLLSFV